MSRVHVAVGVILSSGKDSVLLARRAPDAHQGGLWEFPGGKLETGEDVLEALARELREELAIEVIDTEPLLCIEHDYSDKAVTLDVWLVTRFEGKPQACEDQPLRWNSISELEQLPFPEANRPIIAALLQRFS